MLPPDSGALRVSRLLLHLFRALNFGVGILLLLAIPATFLFEATVVDFFSKRPPTIDPGWLLPLLRIWVLLALPFAVGMHILFTRLLEMIATVRAGDPFVPENARRLQTIAWWLLGFELLRLLYGAMAAGMNAAGSNIDWDFSIDGWLGVFLVFVLARVFEHGTRMRDDLGKMI
jgi:hypothetical protein